MINVSDIVSDPELQAPKPFIIQRSAGQFVLGGFQSVVTSIQMFGPVQQASDKEINMLPEADRVSSARSFWSTVPIYTTRGYAPVASTHGELPQAVSYPASILILSGVPTGGFGTLFKNGLMLTQGVDYTLQGNIVTVTVPIASTDTVYFQWPVEVFAEPAASDILLFEGEQYRVMRVYRDPGGGYYKAVGVRMNAA